VVPMAIEERPADSNRRREDQPSGSTTDRGALPPIPWISFAITIGSAAVAAAASRLIPGAAGWAVAVVVALLGGGAALLMGKQPAVESPELAERVEFLERERVDGRAARLESDRMRHQIEIATATLRDGKDPLTEVAELRVGPLHPLLEAFHAASATGPVISRIAMSEEELLGVEAGELPRSWPQSPPDRVGVEPAAVGGALAELDDLIQQLEDLSNGTAASGMTASGMAAGESLSAEASASAAGLVDALVHTAADGIEDIAAGLMRANELASVAERVTNRATLLALNAALEATRSGSEPFAAIAEETRRLAEYAREATDTMTRLASEIATKVEQTITAIHADSEDAKTALAALGTSSSTAATFTSAAPVTAAALLDTARAIRVQLLRLDQAAEPSECERPLPSR